MAKSKPKYKVDKSVPFPTKYNRREPPLLYPWDKLRKGDSIFVKCQKDKAELMRNTLIAAGNSYFKRRKKKVALITSLVDGGVRIWRYI